MELSAGRFAPAAPLLLAGVGDHLAVKAALAGAVPGRLFLAGDTEPGAALLVSHRLYLAGSPAAAAALAADLKQHVLPAARTAGWNGLLLHLAGPEWQASLPGLLPGSILHAGPYHTYRQQTAGPQALPALPPGLSLQPVEPALVAEAQWQHAEALLEEMLSERPSVQAFLDNSFGTVLVDWDAPGGPALAGWCLSEYNLADECEVGIATLEGYRHRGLATAMGLAFINQAVAAGVAAIGWQCWGRNASSVATAHRLGFRLVSEHPAVYAELRL